VPLARSRTSMVFGPPAGPRRLPRTGLRAAWSRVCQIPMPTCARPHHRHGGAVRRHAG